MPGTGNRNMGTREQEQNQVNHEGTAGTTIDDLRAVRPAIHDPGPRQVLQRCMQDARLSPAQATQDECLILICFTSVPMKSMIKTIRSNVSFDAAAGMFCSRVFSFSAEVKSECDLSSREEKYTVSIGAGSAGSFRTTVLQLSAGHCNIPPGECQRTLRSPVNQGRALRYRPGGHSPSSPGRIAAVKRRMRLALQDVERARLAWGTPSMSTILRPSCAAALAILKKDPFRGLLIFRALTTIVINDYERKENRLFWRRAGSAVCARVDRGPTPQSLQRAPQPVNNRQRQIVAAGR